MHASERRWTRTSSFNEARLIPCHKAVWVDASRLSKNFFLSISWSSVNVFFYIFITEIWTMIISQSGQIFACSKAYYLFFSNAKSGWFRIFWVVFSWSCRIAVSVLCTVELHGETWNIPWRFHVIPCEILMEFLCHVGKRIRKLHGDSYVAWKFHGRVSHEIPSGVSTKSH